MPRSSRPASDWLIVDEALAGFLPTTAPILDHPRVIQVRSFSKIHAMAGFRVGYAVVPEGGPDLRPVLGVGAPALAGALWAVEQRRRVRAPAPRAGPTRSASGWPRSSTSRRAPVPTPGCGRRWPRRWPRAGSTSRPGRPGATSEHVRVTLSDAAATDRLLEALRSL